MPQFLMPCDCSVAFQLNENAFWWKISATKCMAYGAVWHTHTHTIRYQPPFCGSQTLKTEPICAMCIFKKAHHHYPTTGTQHEIAMTTTIESRMAALAVATTCINCSISIKKWMNCCSCKIQLYSQLCPYNFACSFVVVVDLW